MTNEQLSEWLDGELDDEASARCMQALDHDSRQRETCGLYWMIGDCLRGEAAEGDVRSRVMAALVDEPTVLAPVARPKVRETPRWMPMAAAVAGVTFAVWMGLSVWSGPASRQQAQAVAVQQPVAAPVLAAASAPDSAATDNPAEVLADERGYLMAHQASAMGAPMAGVAQYIRTVSVDQTDGR